MIQAPGSIHRLSVGGTNIAHKTIFVGDFGFPIPSMYGINYLHLLSFTIKTKPNLGKYTMFPWIHHGFLTPKES